MTDIIHLAGVVGCSWGSVCAVMFIVLYRRHRRLVAATQKLLFGGEGERA